MTIATTTILFTDIVGSTELLQAAGDERAHRDFREHHRRLIEAVATHNGERVKWQGDGVMAAFSSATDAVRCAIRMQQSVTRATSFGLRVGINVGDALRSDDEDYFGSAVVIAARLCSQARSGQILCSSLVMGLLSGGQPFEFHDVGPLSLKGIAAPVAAYEVVYESIPPPHDWTERESAQYRQLAAIAVPDRADQIAVIFGLLPFDKTDSFRVVDLACGEGALSYGVMHLFPRSSVVALDISESMRQHAAACLAPFGQRVTVGAFDLASNDWLPELAGADVVLSTLALHHLADGDKRRVFADVFARLNANGVFLLADIVEVRHGQQRELFGDIYEHIARRQSLDAGGSLTLFDKFIEDHWNFYRHGLPPGENPAPLFDQLSWLRTSGFEFVDCYWLRAGFAVYGGYKSRHAAPAERRITFEEAVHAAEIALNAARQE